MDAAYLKKNVMEALTEALTSMAVQIPEDNVEYLGKYLLKYVERKKKAEESKSDLSGVEADLEKYLVVANAKAKVQDDKKQEEVVFQTKYRRFLDSLQFDYSNKQDAFNAVTEFIENNLNIPAAYIAVKKTAGESETLNYVAAGPSQKHVLGNKLVKVAAEDGDEAPPRQGISFEAFKLPEVPEEEEPAEEPEEGAEPVVKVPPKAQPLIIENAMREKRCKFFGIPRLGAYAAIPVVYQSIEHDEGVVMGSSDAPTEEGVEPPPADYVFSTKESQFLIAVDTVGKFRTFKAAEIERLVEIGNELVKLFTKLEQDMGEKHKEYLKSDAFLKANEGAKGDFAAKVAEAEAAALAAVAEQITAQLAAAAAAAAEAAAAQAGEDGEGGGEAPAGVSELLKPYKEAEAVLETVWNLAVSASGVAAGIVSLQKYLLPPAAPVLNLLYAVGLLLGFEPAQLQNVCGDADWQAIQKNGLAEYPGRIATYQAAAPRLGGNKLNTLASIKAFAESSGILDPSVYPANMALCSVAVLPWLQKALAAREAAIAYHAEIGVALE
eukprot:CAMPEP_0184980082 /NCGR_PEP_ID=MMETSP1098-20130426/10113_1 /TAXON_ID=89044 /ORGANISM="Spumella elongata, Strain CCAP 955/1" /LENGTH=550 /DNA_ID=CAMNT_0027503443 /DNA_START=31 /DNA_END=1683 /DNA_ORIENTATION=-